jgi:hypothetical protein
MHIHITRTVFEVTVPTLRLTATDGKYGPVMRTYHQECVYGTHRLRKAPCILSLGTTREALWS